MVKFVLIILAVVMACGGILFFLLLKLPDLSGYQHLRNPRITTLADTTVLIVPFETTTDELKTVFGFLMKNYFKLKGVVKNPWKIKPTAARYENAMEFDMAPEELQRTFASTTWKGEAAIPLPSSITDLPELKHETLKARISRWHYGETAEILHLGPYENEAPTVNRLKKYIADRGYEISGPHEEVYLRSPGTPFCKPERYVTVIRYPVRKAKHNSAN
ncbi:GyrI-like domain-containing protein [Desulfomarina sp.]